MIDFKYSPIQLNKEENVCNLSVGGWKDCNVLERSSRFFITKL